MAVLKAYFDEAGSSGDTSGFFVVSGYVAPESEWENFDKKWDRLLKKPCHFPVQTRRANYVCRPLDYLHAVEMEGLGKGRFRRLGQRNRDYLINGSVTAIITSGLIGIGYGVQLNTYSTLGSPARAVIGDPYFLLFQSVIIETAEQAQMFLGEDSKENIAFIFEKNPIWELPLQEMYNLMLEEGLGPRYRMGTLSFADKKEFNALQAADRLCYETNLQLIHGEDRPQLKRLLDWPQHHGRQFNEIGLREFIAELKRSGKL